MSQMMIEKKNTLLTYMLPVFCTCAVQTLSSYTTKYNVFVKCQTCLFTCTVLLLYFFLEILFVIYIIEWVNK